MVAINFLSQFTLSLAVLLFYALASFGLGSLILFKNNKAYLEKLIIGFYFTPLITVVITNFITFEIRKSFVILLFVSVLSLFLQFLKNYVIKDITQFLKSKENRFFLSLVILAAVSYTTYLAIYNYEASYWDEFSHWLTQPKQYFYHNTFISESFTQLAYIDYSPGQPIIGIYFDKIFCQTLNLNHLLLSHFFHFLLVVSFIYKIIFKNVDKNPENHFIFLFLILLLAKLGLPYNALIETNQILALSIFFCLFYDMYKDSQIDNQKQHYEIPWIFLSAIISFTYFLKSGMSLLIITTLFGLLLTQYNFKKLLLKFSFIILLFLTSYLSWKYTFLDHQNLLNHEPHKSLNILADLFQQRSQIILDSIKLLLKSKYFLISGLALILVYTKTNFKFLKLILFYFITYYISLLVVYILFFGPFEALQLASFDRYMSLPIFSFIIFFILSSLPQYQSIKKSTIVSKINLPIQFFASKFKINFTLASCVIFTLFFSYIISSKFRPTRHSEFKDAISLFKKINKYTFENNIKIKNNLMIIDQNSKNVNGVIIKYMSLEHRFGPYEGDYLTSFGPEQDNVWRKIQSKQEMVDRIKSKSVTVVLNTDSWFSAIINSDFSNCTDLQLPYIIYFENDRYTCKEIKN